MRPKNGAGDNPYEHVWDDEVDEDADPTSERLGPHSPPPSGPIVTAHGKRYDQERSSMHWPGHQRD